MSQTHLTADVVVIGLGAMGSQALWRLATMGVDVIGVEQFKIGHSRGSSHGESRIIRTAYAEGEEYVPLLRMAWKLWRELEAKSNQSLLLRTGGLMLGPPTSPIITGPIASAQKHGLSYEILSASELRRRYPQHRVQDDIIGFFEYDAGILYPERAISAAIEVAKRHGAQVLQQSKVVAFDKTSVTIEGGITIHVSHVIVAAGGWLSGLLPMLAPQLRVVRRVVGWFDAPPNYEPENFPVFIRTDESGGKSWYGFPSVNGSIKLGIHSWPGLDEGVDPELGARAPDEEDRRLFSEVAAANLPGIDFVSSVMASCMYTMTPDCHFLVGQHEGITVLGGFSGHGFKFASVIGEAAAQLATAGKSELALSLFDPQRLKH